VVISRKGKAIILGVGVPLQPVHSSTKFRGQPGGWCSCARNHEQ